MPLWSVSSLARRAGVVALTVCSAVVAVPGPARSSDAGRVEAHPVVETEPVLATGDAADDPAVWVDQADPAASLVLGTDKESDVLEVYDLSGKRLQRLPDRNGLINNVDVQPGFPLGGRSVGLVATAGSDIQFFAIDPGTRAVTDVTPAKAVYGQEGAAGVCLYTSPRSGRTYVFTTAVSGLVQQFELSEAADGKVHARSVRGPWDVDPAPNYDTHDGEVESCAVDDETGTFYVTEQAIGVWAYGAEPTDSTDPAARDLVVGSSAYNGGPAVADLEGVAVVDGPGGAGWVIVSSQGNDTYVVLDRAAPHALVGTFVVGPAGSIDGCSHTDGIDAIPADLGGPFTHGLFVCQDDRNTAGLEPGGNQNFKFVPLEQVVPLAPADGPAPLPAEPTTSTTGEPAPPVPVQVPGAAGEEAAPAGYWMIDTDGRVYRFGAAADFGSPAGRLAPHTAAVDLEPTSTGGGYWILAGDGRIYPCGDAVPLGDLAGKLRPGETAAALSATPSGRGYWIYTDRGRVAAFGDAPFLGDVADVRLNGPVLDSIATPSGQGYYMVASDGGIFAFGDARFYGSMGNQKLNAPVQSLVPDGDGIGYWLVAGDGGVFAFQAGFHGSLGAVKLNKPITGMVRAGAGYLMVGEDGGIFDFSDSPDGFQGSLGAHPPARPITSVAIYAG